MATVSAPHDDNHVPATVGTSSTDGATPVLPWTDPITHRQLVDANISSATVSGGKGNNTAVAGTTNIGVLPAVANVSAPTYTEGNQVALSTDLTGAVRVNIASGSTGNAAASNTGSAVPTQADYGGINVAGTLRGQTGVNVTGTVYAAQVDITSMNGVAVSMNNGTSDTGTQRVTLASNSTGQVALAAGSNTVGTVTIGSIVAGSNTIGTVTVNSLPALPTGSNTVGTVSVNTLPAIPTGSNTIGTVTINSLPAVVNATGSNTIGTVQVSVLPAIPTGSNTIGTVSINSIPAVVNATGSNTIGTVQVSVLPALAAGSNAIGSVSIASYPATAATVNITQILGSAIITGGVTGSQAVGGPTASGASLVANPQTTGGLAKTANPTAVTDGQVVNSLHDKLGKQVVVGSIRDLKGNQFTTINNSTAETTVVTAVASTFLDVYGCIVTNNAAAVNKVTFKDSTSGTTQFTLEVPATDTRGFMLNESGAYKQTTVNNNWTATCGTSGSVEISMLYVKNL